MTIDMFINKYVLSVIGTIMAWLFFYAFKHPAAYHKRSPMIMLLSFTVFLSTSCWYISAKLQLHKIISLVPKKNTDEIQQLINSAEINLNTTLIVFLIFNGYMMLLFFIHDILGIKEPKKEEIPK